jgi:hypothetical protein
VAAIFERAALANSHAKAWIDFSGALLFSAVPLRHVDWHGERSGLHEAGVSAIAAGQLEQRYLQPAGSPLAS